MKNIDYLFILAILFLGGMFWKYFKNSKRRNLIKEKHLPTEENLVTYAGVKILKELMEKESPPPDPEKIEFIKKMYENAKGNPEMVGQFKSCEALLNRYQLLPQ